MDKKSQGSMEYILLLAGVLLIVVLVIIILRGNVFSAADHQIQQNYNTFANISNTSNCSLAGC
ncbi:class III signal peptide-containing protein [Candidatus Micrarchaeota archaeon]|nr:class III signal peptide-containing protein [Candidatus Micrarchaeota archaeon]